MYNKQPQSSDLCLFNKQLAEVVPIGASSREKKSPIAQAH